VLPKKAKAGAATVTVVASFDTKICYCKQTFGCPLRLSSGVFENTPSTGKLKKGFNVSFPGMSYFELSQRVSKRNKKSCIFQNALA
jgi:hypothetical protein